MISPATSLSGFICRAQQFRDATSRHRLLAHAYAAIQDPGAFVVTNPKDNLGIGSVKTRFLGDSSHRGAYRFSIPVIEPKPALPLSEKPSCCSELLSIENEGLAEGDGQHSNFRRTLVRTHANMNATSHI